MLPSGGPTRKVGHPPWVGDVVSKRQEVQTTSRGETNGRELV
jgi:hypothetical protein